MLQLRRTRLRNSIVFYPGCGTFGRPAEQGAGSDVAGGGAGGHGRAAARCRLGCPRLTTPPTWRTLADDAVQASQYSPSLLLRQQVLLQLALLQLAQALGDARRVQLRAGRR